MNPHCQIFLEKDQKFTQLYKFLGVAIFAKHADTDKKNQNRRK